MLALPTLEPWSAQQAPAPAARHDPAAGGGYGGGMDPSQAIVSVDTVPLYLDAEDRLRVRLVRRPWAPFEGAWALPGVMLRGMERLHEAAGRALVTKADLRAEQVLALHQIAAFDDLERDPRGPTIALAQLAILPQDLEPADGVDVLDVAAHETPDLAFDHQRILTAALHRLSELLLADAGLSRALLGAEFPTTRVNRAYTALEAAGAPGASTSGMSRRLAATPRLHPTGRTQAVGRGKPAPVWAWASDDAAPVPE